MRRKRGVCLLLATAMMFSVPVFETPAIETKAASSAGWIWNVNYSESGYKKVPVAELTGTADSQDEGQETQSTGGNKTGGYYENAVDGVTTSYWHTNYAGNNQATVENGVLNSNNTYTITLANATDVAGVTVLPRQDAYGNGAIIQGDVQVQYDESEDWVNVLTDFFIDKHGSQAKYNQNKGEYELLFEAAQQNVKKIKFTAKRTGEQANSTDHTESGTSAFITAAEFSVLTTEKVDAYYHVSASVRSGCEGMGTATVANSQIVQGAPTTCTATPNAGYRFVRWEDANGQLISRDATMTVIPAADTTYYAVFQMKETYTENVMKKSGVEVTVSEGGTISSSYPATNIYDGNTNTGNYMDYNFPQATDGEGYVQINLGKVYSYFDCMKLYRYRQGNRKYGPTIIALSKDAEFTDPTIIFNSNQGKDGSGADLSWNPTIGTISAGTGTDDLYTETDAGREFVIPAGTEAQYIRIYTAGKNSGSNNSQHIVELEVYVSQEGLVPRSEIKSATTGTARSGSTTDGGADFALDGNTSTWWHSDWSSDAGKLNKFWIDLEFNEPTVVDGINTLPRETGQYKNGMITAYEVWISTKEEVKEQTSAEDESWKDDYVKVCAGTWQTSSTANTWKYTKFEPVEAKHVRLVATATAGYEGENKHVSLIELRVAMANSEEGFFKGGALRMDAPDGQANLRLQYEFPTTFNDMDLQDNTWSWNYGKAVDANGKIADVKTRNVEEGHFNKQDGTCYSNLVVKEIQEANYESDIYAQLVIPYANDAGETLNVYTSVESRSVKEVAQKVATSGSTQEQREYANKLLGNTLVQLKTTTGFDGEKVSIDQCAYTFVSDGDNYKISSMDGDTKVWLNMKTGGAQVPNQTTEAAIQVSCTDEKFTFEDQATANCGGFLYFNLNGDYLFNRNGNSNDHCEFEIYKKVEAKSEGQDIPGYEKVTDITAITEDEKYLIAVTSDEAIYVLHPSSNSNTYSHVAKVVK